MDALDGKVAVITGGAGAIGLATGLLGEPGVKVVLADVNEAFIAEAAKTFKEACLK